jgi:hypothetical protein
VLPDRSKLGDMDMVLCDGEGVVMGEPWADRWSPSERVCCTLTLVEAAKAAAVAAAASSMVPL